MVGSSAAGIAEPTPYLLVRPYASILADEPPKTGSAYLDDIVDGGFALDADGMLTVPSEPGLGVRLDLDGLDQSCDGTPIVRRMDPGQPGADESTDHEEKSMSSKALPAVLGDAVGWLASG